MSLPFLHLHWQTSQLWQNHHTYHINLHKLVKSLCYFRNLEVKVFHRLTTQHTTQHIHQLSVHLLSQNNIFNLKLHFPQLRHNQLTKIVVPHIYPLKRPKEPQTIDLSRPLHRIHHFRIKSHLAVIVKPMWSKYSQDQKVQFVSIQQLSQVRKQINCE